MKAKKNLLIFISLICFVLIFSACSKNQQTGANKKHKIVIGVALPNFNDKWLTYLHQGMKEYAGKLDDVDIIYVDAQNDSGKQFSQVETFISQQVDSIVIMPVDPSSASGMVDQANDANIPTIIVNRSFKGMEKATSYVGSESITSGKIQMEEVAKKLNGKGNIAIMTGALGQEAVIKRTEGNKEILSKYPEMKIVKEGTANWDREKALSLMENWLNSGVKIDAVVANNDEMAIGAAMAAEAAGKLDEILIAGIDATPDALEYVNSDKIAVTVYQNAIGQGQSSLETAIKAARGEKVKKNIYIPYELVTKDNVEEYVEKWK